tara:strand:- start:110 stop:1516 length:1407 start_codon:yes stop_codon:yes gene_type:complete
MQKNKLDVLLNFIINNSKYKKKIYDRFQIDSRRIGNNQVFLSLDDDAANNLKNIKNAIKNNASAIVTSLKILRKDLKTSIPFIIIKDLKNIYYKIYLELVKSHKTETKIIGITGTNGKTSTSLLLANALSNIKKKVGVITSEGIGVYPTLKENDYTTPTLDIIYKSIDRFLSLRCDYIIIECSSQGLHQGRLKGIIFDYSIITNIYSDHLDYHKTIKRYINSKLMILNQSKLVFLNYLSPILKKLDFSKFKKTKVEYIAHDKDYIECINKMYHNFVNDNAKNFHISSLLFVKSIMKAEGIKDYLIKKSISNLRVIKGRRNIIHTKKKGIFIIDYAHTTQSYEEIYNEFDTKKSITTLFGCGGDRDKTKRKNTGRIVDRYSSSIFITEDNSRSEEFILIARDILKGIKKKSKCIIEKSRKKALKKLIIQSRSHDINFILGKGNESYIIRGKQKIRHNDMKYIMDMVKKV